MERLTFKKKFTQKNLRDFLRWLCLKFYNERFVEIMNHIKKFNKMIKETKKCEKNDLP